MISSHQALPALALLLLSAPLSPAAQPAAPDLDRRWFFSFGYGRNREDVDAIKSLVDTASDHGLNGMVLSSFGLDRITRWKADDLALLKELHAHCVKRNVELIPTGLNVGYGGGALVHDRNFAAALPTVISLTARDGRLVPASSGNLLGNGDLEQHRNNRFAGFGFHDQPGTVSFADPETTASGRSSIRFENFRANEHGHGRINQKIAVKPGRTYRFSFRIRTKDLDPVSGLKAMVFAKGRSLTSKAPQVKPTQDWTEVSLEFVNSDHREVAIYAGMWGGRSGAFWLDDLCFEEHATLIDIVRRKGTPLELRSLDRDKVFAEGGDFRPLKCLHYEVNHPLPPDSAIRDGERLALSCYKIPAIHHAWGKQISLCMSNPDLYRHWQTEARRLREVIPYKRFLLAIDEIRNGGGCLSCRERDLTMAEILGDCVTRQHAILKDVDPNIEVLTWSDMLDPAHNAHDNYYGVVGDFTGSWKHVPKDLTIVCWHHKIRDQSLSFFSKQGFPTMGAAYYDADDLTNPQEWLASLRRTNGARGIMYTSWKKYALLGAFGDLLRQ